MDSRIIDGMEEVFTVFVRPDPSGNSWGERLEVMRTCIGKLKARIRRALECVYQRGHCLQKKADELLVGAPP